MSLSDTYDTCHPQNQMQKWVKEQCEQIADYGIFRICRCTFSLPSNQKSGVFTVIESSDWVVVLAETTQGDMVLVKQFRFGSEEFSLEIPGGIVDPGETPMAAAIRELEEETGYCGEVVGVVATFHPNPAIQTNIVNVVLIKNCQKLKPVDFDEFEDIATIVMSKQQVLAEITAGRISHVIPVAAILKYMFLS